MKTLMLLALFASPAAFSQTTAPAVTECPQLGGVYYQAGQEPRVYALFTQTDCLKLDIKLLAAKGPEIYFSVPVIGEPLSTDSLGATFQAFWKDGQLYSEATTRGEIAVYKINLRPFDGGVVQVSDYEIRVPGQDNRVHHEVITWERVQ